MNIEEQKGIYLTSTKEYKLECDEDLKQKRIKDFLDEVETNLNNYKNIKTKIARRRRDTTFKITISDKVYFLDSEELDFISKNKLYELYTKYKDIKRENKYGNGKTIDELKSEIKNEYKTISKDSLILSLHVLRRLSLPGYLAFLGYEIKTGVFAVDTLNIIVCLTALISNYDIVNPLNTLYGKNSYLFGGIEDSYKKLKEDIQALKLRNKALERKKLIAKIKELNNRDSNGINIDTGKEEQIAKLLEKLRKKTTYEIYESIAQDLSEKKEEQALEEPSNVHGEISVSQQSYAAGQAYHDVPRNKVMRKVLKR